MMKTRNAHPANANRWVDIFPRCVSRQRYLVRLFCMPQKAAMKAVVVEDAVRVETMAVACEARQGCPSSGIIAIMTTLSGCCDERGRRVIHLVCVQAGDGTDYIARYCLGWLQYERTPTSFRGPLVWAFPSTGCGLPGGATLGSKGPGNKGSLVKSCAVRRQRGGRHLFARPWRTTTTCWLQTVDRQRYGRQVVRRRA